MKQNRIHYTWNHTPKAPTIASKKASIIIGALLLAVFGKLAKIPIKLD